MTPAVEFMQLFEEFRAPSWDGWRRILGRLTPSVRELFVASGRGSGKSRAGAVLATWASTRTYRRAPGEEITVGVFAPDRKQAAITFNYIRGLLKSRPELRALILRETRERLDLHGGLAVEVLTAGRASPRGRSYGLAVIEEAAFLPVGEGVSDPDIELVRALRPALARVENSLLCVVGSPYAPRGILYDAVQAGDAEDRVVVTADTRTLNPTFRAAEIARAFAVDPVSAASEYGRDGTIAFRRDVETFIGVELVRACVAPGVTERPPRPGVTYTAFTDPSGGSGTDSFTLAVGHVEAADGGERVVVLDALRARVPPCNPSDVVREYAGLLARYHVREIVGDRYAGSWPSEAFARHGIRYLPSAQVKSDLYRDSLPVLNSGKVALLDVPALVMQIARLERRTGWSGRDAIDHVPGSHDDLANSALGLVALLAARPVCAIRGLTW